MAERIAVAEDSATGFNAGSGSGSGSGLWTGKIFFSPDPNGEKESVLKLEADEVLKIGESADIEGFVRQIEVFTCPLNLTRPLKNRKGYFFHAFVVLESSAGFFSVEKLRDCVFVQFSKEKESLLNRVECEPRPQPVRLFREGVEGKGRVSDVIQFIVDRKFLSRDYDLWRENCKFCSKEVYGQFNSKNLAIEVGPGKEFSHPVSSRGLDTEFHVVFVDPAKSEI